MVIEGCFERRSIHACLATFRLFFRDSPALCAHPAVASKRHPMAEVRVECAAVNGPVSGPRGVPANAPSSGLVNGPSGVPVNAPRSGLANRPIHPLEAHSRDVRVGLLGNDGRRDRRRSDPIRLSG